MLKTDEEGASHVQYFQLIEHASLLKNAIAKSPAEPFSEVNEDASRSGFVNQLWDLLENAFWLRNRAYENNSTVANSIFEKPAPYSPNEDGNILNWDFTIEPKAPRSSGKFKAKLRYIGKGTPTPVSDPWA